MRIGLIYDVFEAYPWRPGEAPDADAEYEPAETVEALAEAIRRLGHEPLPIGAPRDLPARLPGLSVDLAVNIAEGAHTRNREAWAPVLLEMAGIPCLGSDALTLSVSLDKVFTKDLARAAGLCTPAYRAYRRPEDATAESLPAGFPLFVKPRYEGSSKGITPRSKVAALGELRRQVARICADYRQDALVEAFVGGGGEFTVCVVGNDPPEALPAIQRAVEPATGIGLHALEHRGAEPGAWGYTLEGALTPALEAALQADAVAIYEKLGCLDFARADFRVDAAGQVWFLEINPLPTFAPDGTFAILAELMGLDYCDFLAGVLARGIRRLEAAATLRP